MRGEKSQNCSLRNVNTVA